MSKHKKGRESRPDQQSVGVFALEWKYSTYNVSFNTNIVRILLIVSSGYFPLLSQRVSASLLSVNYPAVVEVPVL